MNQSGQSSRSPNALSREHLGNCADFVEANSEFVCQKNDGTCTITEIRSKGLRLKHVKKLPTSQQDNRRGSCRISARFWQWPISPHDEQRSSDWCFTRYHQEFTRNHRHYDRQQEGRVDGRSDSVCQRFGRFCHNDAVGRFFSTAFSGFIVRK